MNLSETAFVFNTNNKNYDTSNRFGLRWFTPKCEVALCGHATLAAAAVLFHVCKNPSEAITFETMSGELMAQQDATGSITLDFPLNPPQPCSAHDDFELLARAAVRKVAIRDLQYSPTTKKLLVRLDDSATQQTLEGLKVNSADLLACHSGDKVKGVIVTVLGSAPYHFCSRYFAPWVGIMEDPVTGSAHTVLAAYWSKVLGKEDLIARQCSSRGGDLKLGVRDDGRVNITGTAKLVLKGTLQL